MAEDIKPEVLKKTQTALNKFIKKPPLTEKLLKKPPFRFLHDIITSVIRETGFLKDVFTPEELISDNVKDKDSKIKFLTKLIGAVKDTTGISIKAKPSKIVAGLEVDKTLELLQVIAKGIAQTNANKAVINNRIEKNKPENDSGKIVSDSKSKVVTVEQNDKKPEGAVKDKKKTEKKREESKDGIENSKEKKKREKSEKRVKSEKPKGKELKRRESFPSPEVNNGPQVLETENLCICREGINKDNDNNSLEVPAVDGNIEQINNKETLQNAEITKQPSIEKEEIQLVNKEEDIIFRHKEEENKDSEVQKVSNEEVTLKRPSTRRSSSRSNKQPMKAISEKEDNEKDRDDSKLTKGSSAEIKTDIKKVKGINDKDTEPSDDQVIRPPSAIERPRTARRAPPVVRPPSARPKSGRPLSLRPGAPKTRDRGEVTVEQNQEKEETKEVVVITENEKAEEEKENMVVVEPHSLNLDEEINEDLSSSGGGILDDFLESSGAHEKKKTQKNQVEIEWEGGQREKKANWQKECDQLRSSIQALTRSTGPLGKLFDFLQEDVDLAARELSYWRQASADYASQLVAEQRETELLLSKHRKKLSELEGLIEEEQEAIRVVKSSILVNDKKILSLISRVPTGQ